MGKLLSILLSSFCVLCSICLAQQSDEPPKDTPSQQYESSRKFEQSPVSVLNSVKWNANKNKSDQVQNTKLDGISSRIGCQDIPLDTKYTISRTLCNIKWNIKSYLDYLVYIWLTAATILIIWNWFKLVTSEDRWKQIWEFKKNIINIIIWVVLVIGFYYIIDIFVSVVNLIVE